jgi:dihydrofolate synthase/folylpolyglutamate synthase
VTFSETVDYLFARLPMFQNIGKEAYKKDLTNTIALLEVLDNPHLDFPWIHIAGTNGKGSTSSMINSILIEAGYQVGLFTSPHLKSFTERIRVNGLEIEQDYVIDFVDRIKPHIETIQPSFFEITVAMCFDYFRKKKIDIGVIEVGLGGRLDSTNVIQPILSLITSIGFDHMDILGDSLEKIAFEKAGIIKPHIPVVVNGAIEKGALGEIESIANAQASNIIYALDLQQIKHLNLIDFLSISNTDLNLQISELMEILELKGLYQNQNLSTVLFAIREIIKQNYKIDAKAIINGLKRVKQNSGLRGRWEIIQEHPQVICDTGHNEDGVKSNIKQLLSLKQPEKIHIIWGMVKDKDRSKILQLLPKNSQYYLIKPSVIRGFDAPLLEEEFRALNILNTEVFESASAAFLKAKSNAQRDDLIFIGGSTFTVADFLIETE